MPVLRREGPGHRLAIHRPVPQHTARTHAECTRFDRLADDRLPVEHARFGKQRAKLMRNLSSRRMTFEARLPLPGQGYSPAAICKS